jgi:DNA replication and repair protein RecF
MLTNLRLQHYRSYDEASFDFQSGVNIIVGPNASGKTNLLEAILMIAAGSSYRAKDAELIAFEEAWARIDATLANNTLRTMKLQMNPLIEKSYEISGKPYKRLTMQARLPVVLFEPNHLQLLAGSPEQRRSYLDDLLEQTVSGFATVRRQYRRTLAQRNSLLKHESSNHDQLFPWNIRLSQLAGQIVRARANLVAEIDSQLNNLYKNLAQSDMEVKIVYHSRWSADGYESNLLKRLEESNELDKLRGFTSAGPHREDFMLLYNGHPASEVASRGETRTGVLALKFIELQIIQAAREQSPLLLLDDVFSELDGARRRALTEHLADYQTFITTTDADIVLNHFTNDCHVIAISQTTVE